MEQALEFGKADATSQIGRVLIAEIDAYLKDLYPDSIGLCYRASPEEINTNGIFFLATLDGNAVGCGALKRTKFDEIELKRFYLRPEARGKGLAKKMLAILEAEALAMGFETIFLETGPPQIEAVALYEGAGYERCGPFGGYPDNPLSIFMEKRLVDELSQSNGSAA
ncbi:GNAT family N-acetyltransferase [Hirschia litorea]|uniref:GNAT family N-acetyltransferase n=1 Tax=Hirschia litorea TaxID=1199156 RepID=A0ABW2IH50_9PROT